MSNIEYHIMLVDDEDGIRGLFPVILRKVNKNVIVKPYANGRETWEALQQTPPESRPHLVITDTEMPEITGIELVNKIRQCYPAIAAVRMSGNPATNPDFVKPLDMPTLSEILKKYNPREE